MNRRLVLIKIDMRFLTDYDKLIEISLEALNDKTYATGHQIYFKGVAIKARVWPMELTNGKQY